MAGTHVTSQFTDGTSSDAVQSFLNKLLLERGLTSLTAQLPVMTKPMSKRSGTTMIFRRYESYALATTALTEGVTPTGKTITKTDVKATLAPYGDFTELGTFLTTTQPEDVVMEVVELHGQQAGETFDKLYMNEWATQSTNLIYANGSATASVNTIAAYEDFNKAHRQLSKAKARRFVPMINASQKVGTGSIMPSYWGIITEDVFFDIRANFGTNFLLVSDYGNAGASIQNEVGGLKIGIRLLATQNGEVSLGGGATGGTGIQETTNVADVHSSFICGTRGHGRGEFLGWQWGRDSQNVWRFHAL